MPKHSFAIAFAACLSSGLTGCGEPAPPRSVDYFMREAAALQATLFRCRDPGFNPGDDPECANARQAAERLGAQDAEAKRAEREAEFQRNRAALRRRLEREAQAAESWPEDKAIEPPLGVVSDPRTDATLSDEALEAEIHRLQDELERRRHGEMPGDPDTDPTAVSEPAPPPE
ncbi:MAG: EexN family lipoprotein [Gammaproteobacteria bacterium]|nr:EexN family lipoprotein [Gammaproteobacteria bacterium]